MNQTTVAPLEHAPCALGCRSGETVVLQGGDRLHGFPGMFTVVRCNTCGLMRTNPRPGPEQMRHFYPADYKPYLDTRITASAPATKPERRRRPQFDSLNHALPDMQPGKMLEIGCGSGKFLQEMMEVGWSGSGLEPSESAGQAARKSGFPVMIGSLEAIADVGGPYDLVVGWMVLEHLHDPVGSLRKLRGATRPGAWLALSVPDAGSWEFRHFRDAWYALQLPTHLHHFTPDTVVKVLAAGGWHLERVLWQRDAKNLLNSLRYRCLDRGWLRLASVFEAMVAGKRARRLVRLLARILCALRASGRITVWARRSDSTPA